jgi:pimeloyl-ACP methyl ester carboxylesterase
MRIGQYLAEDLQFESFEASVQYMKKTAASFGPHSDEQWATLTRHYFVPRDGRWVKHYDPSIATAFAGVTQDLMTQGEQMLWGAYACVNAPTLILHGAQSDLLLTDTIQKMVQLNPQATAIRFPGVGHAPSLIIEDQIQAVVGFFDEN